MAVARRRTAVAAKPAPKKEAPKKVTVKEHQETKADGSLVITYTVTGLPSARPKLTEAQLNAEIKKHATSTLPRFREHCLATNFFHAIYPPIPRPSNYYELPFQVQALVEKQSPRNGSNDTAEGDRLMARLAREVADILDKRADTKEKKKVVAKK